MKKIQNYLIILCFAALIFPQFGALQTTPENDLAYEVNKIYPYISTTKSELKDAQTLTDINKHYKASWVKAYVSVEISTIHQGKLRTSVNKSDVLSQEQKNHILTADVDTDIAVKVLYFPDNTLKTAEIKEINFSFKPMPETEATYFGGEAALKKYLKENAIDEIPNNSFENYDLAAVKFTIDENGQVTNVQLFQSSKNEKIDDLLVKTVRNMPNWQPAKYENGTAAKQEFAWTIGNMESCVINLLNIHRD